MQSFAVILAGGSGTRFWPASRRALPKQFLPIGASRSLVAQTVARLEGLIEPERILVVSARDQAQPLAAALPHLPPENFLLEPAPRNTAACVAWAAFEIRRREPRSVQVVLPADHVIRPVERLRESLRAGMDEAIDSGALVTFGIRPTRPATGFGYIELGERSNARGSQPVFRVKRFVEKPDAKRAQQFLDAGTFLWNSGLFAWRTDSILAALGRHLPATAAALAELPSGLELDQAYARLASVSIDVAVLEQERDVRTLGIDYFWSDVGTWTALADVVEPDAFENRATGGTALETLDARNNIVYGEQGQLVALLGVEGLVVVRAGNAVFVSTRARADEVRRLVDRLGESGSPFV